MKVVYLVCGVPGSGKTWVCKQLTDKCTYLAHDEHYKDHYGAITDRLETCTKPLITESSLGISKLIHQLEADGVKVHPYFILEAKEVVKDRYEKREKKNIPLQHLGRIATIYTRAKEYAANKDAIGTSQQILKVMKADLG